MFWGPLQKDFDTFPFPTVKCVPKVTLPCQTQEGGFWSAAPATASSLMSMRNSLKHSVSANGLLGSVFGILSALNYNNVFQPQTGLWTAILGDGASSKQPLPSPPPAKIIRKPICPEHVYGRGPILCLPCCCFERQKPRFAYFEAKIRGKGMKKNTINIGRTFSCLNTYFSKFWVLLEVKIRQKMRPLPFLCCERFRQQCTIAFRNLYVLGSVASWWNRVELVCYHLQVEGHCLRTWFRDNFALPWKRFLDLLLLRRSFFAEGASHLTAMIPFFCTVNRTESFERSGLELLGDLKMPPMLLWWILSPGSLLIAVLRLLPSVTYGDALLSASQHLHVWITYTPFGKHRWDNSQTYLPG